MELHKRFCFDYVFILQGTLYFEMHNCKFALVWKESASHKGLIQSQVVLNLDVGRDF